VARSGSVSFTVSLQGPRAELLEPGATSPTWERGSGGLWDLRLRSADRNGTASVEATIAATGAGAPVPLVLDLLRREGSDEVDTVWESSLRLGPDWSTREVEIRIRAQDGAGTEAEVTRQCRLPEIREEHPRLLAVTRRDEPGAPIAPMRLVPGNRDGNYRFHGRGDSIENEQFQRSQIELRTLTWSWDVEFQKDEISDYYLDEHEVTCGEYLAFVRSRTGFADPSLWPRDAEGNPDIPPAPRREEIEKALSSRPADLPVTLVSWAEAWAYARWVGKRLPSFVEWEVAVRGGAQYRPYASFRPDVPRDKDELNFDHRTGSPWPVGRGIDVTPDTGIRNLDTNVMEWTRTPASLTGGGDSSAREEARARPLLFAAQEQEETPAAGSRLYHAVGGHYASSTADASKSDAFDRDERMPYLGFRCAVSARHVARAREGSVDTTLSPVLYRALGPEDASRRSAIDE
jgi:formylglycine-generating enzyme required for sulfatase activity